MFLSAIFITAGCANLSAEKKHSEHGKIPNIIYIEADDLGWFDLGFQGNQFYDTPNIDELASQGMVFTNAYSAATNCAPSRASLMTGQYTPRHGIYTVGRSDRGKSEDRKLIPVKNTLSIAKDNLTIAHALKTAGYKTCTIGKWHISNDPLENGFDINIAGGHGANVFQKGYHSPYNYPNCVQEAEGEYLTDRLTNEAIDFITANKDSSFFLYLAYYTVHLPLEAKPETEAKYARKMRTHRQENAAYAAMIESLDENIGRLLKHIENTGIVKNTLLVFTSDNGALWKISKQWPLRSGKGSYFEGGIRVPLIIRWPDKIEPGTSSDVPVCNIDFFPTFLSVAGASPPKDKLLDGIDLMPLLTQEESVPDRALYWHFPVYLAEYRKGIFNIESENRDSLFRTRPGSAIRYSGWKLHENFEDGALELYQLENDIGERNNLLKKHPEKAKMLHNMLKAWRKKVDAKTPMEINPEYRKTAGIN